MYRQNMPENRPIVLQVHALQCLEASTSDSAASDLYRRYAEIADTLQKYNVTKCLKGFVSYLPKGREIFNMFNLSIYTLRMFIIMRNFLGKGSSSPNTKSMTLISYFDVV